MVKQVRAVNFVMMLIGVSIVFNGSQSCKRGRAEYTIALSPGILRTKNVTVSIFLDSTVCHLSTLNVLFTPFDDRSKQVKVTTTDNVVDEGKRSGFLQMYDISPKFNRSILHQGSV